MPLSLLAVCAASITAHCKTTISVFLHKSKNPLGFLSGSDTGTNVGLS